MENRKNITNPTLGFIKQNITLISILALLFVLLILGGSLYLRYLSEGLPSLSALETFDPHQTTRVFSADGVLIHELYKEKRRIVPFDRIPEDMVNSFIATEDHRFYKHWGVDMNRIFASVWRNIKAMRYAQGFSTATMQLARKLYLNREKNITRKLREIILAVQIEKRYAKSEILEMHLNKEYFGHGAYGIDQAASIYFNKEVDDLLLHECALLTAQLNGPTRFSPLHNPDLAFSRRNLVLRNMLKHGYISTERFLNASQKPVSEGLTVRLNMQLEEEASRIAPYFTEHIRLLLQDMQEQYSFDVYRDGLTVYTTLDTKAQLFAERALTSQLARQQNLVNVKMSRPAEKRILLEKLGFSKLVIDEKMTDEAFLDSIVVANSVVQGAFIAIDNSTGNVLALVGGKDFKRFKYNIATQSQRQAGSIFKPFVYTVAIDNGYPVTTQILNQPVVIINPDQTRWSPRNYDRSTGGMVTLREALRRSLNLVSARLIQEYVPSTEVVALAKKMGLTTYVPAVDAIALGTTDVIPLEMITAYTAFPNKGLRVEPVFITKILDGDGNIKYENRGAIKHEVLNEETAYIMTNLLQTVVQRGSGRYAAITHGFRRPAGGKTGTTNDFSNAWFIGFTPQITAGTWIGLDKPILTLGSSQSGQVVAVPIWAKFMKAYHDTLDIEVLDFERPDGVVDMTICNDTKKKATRYCPDQIIELFNLKYLNEEECDKHTPYKRRIGRN